MFCPSEHTAHSRPKGRHVVRPNLGIHPTVNGALRAPLPSGDARRWALSMGASNGA